jgi:hypothetical protein
MLSLFNVLILGYIQKTYYCALAGARILEKWAIVPPMSVALFLAQRRPDLLWISAHEQKNFMEKSDARSCAESV